MRHQLFLKISQTNQPTHDVIKMSFTKKVFQTNQPLTNDVILTQYLIIVKICDYILRLFGEKFKNWDEWLFRNLKKSLINAKICDYRPTFFCQNLKNWDEWLFLNLKKSLSIVKICEYILRLFGKKFENCDEWLFWISKSHSSSSKSVSLHLCFLVKI